MKVPFIAEPMQPCKDMTDQTQDNPSQRPKTSIQEHQTTTMDIKTIPKASEFPYQLAHNHIHKNAILVHKALWVLRSL